MYPLSYTKNTTSSKQGNFSSLNLFSRQLWLRMYYLLKFGKARKTKSQGWIFFEKISVLLLISTYVCLHVGRNYTFISGFPLSMTWHDAHLSCLSLTMHFFHLPLIDEILLPSQEDFWIVSVKSHPQLFKYLKSWVDLLSCQSKSGKLCINSK